MKYTVVIFLLFLTLLQAENNQTQELCVPAKQLLIQGNKQIETEQYLEALGIEQKSWIQFWKDDTVYIASKVASKASDTLREYLDSRGYYDAKIKVDIKEDVVNIDIQEGKAVIVDEIEIQSDFNLSSIVTFVKGSNFEVSKFVAIKSNIKTELMRAGYCNYKLDTKAYVDLDKRAVSLRYQLAKGELCYFGDTNITSKPEDISDSVILSRLQYNKGDVFSTAKITKTFDALNQLDAFGSGTVSPSDKTNNIVPMEIALAKKDKLNIFRGGVGYDTAVGMRAQLFYERRNFMGDARKLTTILHYSDKQKFGELTLFSPALLSFGDEYFDLFSKLGYSNYIYDTYDENRGYFSLRLGYERDNMNFYLGLGLDSIDIKLNETDPAIIPGNFLLLYPFAEFVYDGRDSKINPKNGYYLSAYLEYGLDYDTDASSYLKFLLEARAIKSFDKLTLAAVGKLGAIDELSGMLPASKLFYAGGAYSNRAYGEREIGTVLSPTSSATLGGKSWLNLSLEANYPIYDELSGAVFVDSTMISKDEYDFSAKTINTMGVGIRYATPIGPIKLDVGANIEDIKQYGIHFQIGQSF